MRPPQAEDRIANFLLEELLGTGSFGQVWKARHFLPGVNRVVAIKIPTNPQYVRQLQREGLTTFGLDHPGIIQPLDLDPYNDPPYLIMEFIDGPSLRQVIDAHPNGLEISRARIIFRAILEALRAAHAADVVHGDVKPANVLIAGGSDLDRLRLEHVKLTDFGLGKVRDNVLATILQSGTFEPETQKKFGGTLAYMAPEQRDAGRADQRSDLYSAGVVLFEMLTGVRPQGGDLPGQIRPGIPAYLDEIFRSCYTSAERRVESAEKLLAELGHTARAGDELHHGACPRCSGPIDSQDQFCIHCGQQLVDVIPRCPSCRGFVNANDRYCVFCGADVHRSAGAVE